MPSKQSIDLPKRKTNPSPAWRTSTAEGPQLEDILHAINSGYGSRNLGHHANHSTVAFATHFMQRRNPLATLIAKLGFYISDQSKVTVSYTEIRIDQQRTINCWGFKLITFGKTEVMYMHSITQATHHGDNVYLFKIRSIERLTGLCRPTAFTQAVNRMLASPTHPPAENCSSCRHYRRWAVAGNQGECAITKHEQHSDCPQQGHQHWCPQYSER